MGSEDGVKACMLRRQGSAVGRDMMDADLHPIMEVREDGAHTELTTWASSGDLEPSQCGPGATGCVPLFLPPTLLAMSRLADLDDSRLIRCMARTARRVSSHRSAISGNALHRPRPISARSSVPDHSVNHRQTTAGSRNPSPPITHSTSYIINSTQHAVTNIHGIHNNGLTT